MFQVIVAVRSSGNAWRVFEHAPHVLLEEVAQDLVELRFVPLEQQPVRLGLRWIVEATNKWWSNYGQLRRSTDRRNRHRHAALCLATTVLIVGRLIDWRDRWSPTI